MSVWFQPTETTNQQSLGLSNIFGTLHFHSEATLAHLRWTDVDPGPIQEKDLSL